MSERHPCLCNKCLSARDDELARARKAVIYECVDAINRSAWKHEGDDSYSQGMDYGARHQLLASLKEVAALAFPTPSPSPTSSKESSNG